MYINKESATAETLKPTVEWIKKSEDERIKLIGEKLKKNELYKDFEITNAHENGDVIIKIEKTIPAKIRGVLLLEMEAIKRTHEIWEKNKKEGLSKPIDNYKSI